MTKGQLYKLVFVQKIQNILLLFISYYYKYIIMSMVIMMICLCFRLFVDNLSFIVDVNQ